LWNAAKPTLEMGERGGMKFGERASRRNRNQELITVKKTVRLGRKRKGGGKDDSRNRGTLSSKEESKEEAA